MPQNKKADGLLGALELDNYGLGVMCADANDISPVVIKEGVIHFNLPAQC